MNKNDLVTEEAFTPRPGPFAPEPIDQAPHRLVDFQGLAKFLDLDLRTVASVAWRERYGIPCYMINPELSGSTSMRC